MDSTEKSAQQSPLRAKILGDIVSLDPSCQREALAELIRRDARGYYEPAQIEESIQFLGKCRLDVIYKNYNGLGVYKWVERNRDFIAEGEEYEFALIGKESLATPSPESHVTGKENGAHR